MCLLLENLGIGWLLKLLVERTIVVVIIAIILNSTSNNNSNNHESNTSEGRPREDGRRSAPVPEGCRGAEHQDAGARDPRCMLRAV